MVYPYGAGDGGDTIARVVAERVRASLGQPVIIESVPGASGTIGVGRVAGARPDGYTLVFGNLATHVVNAPLFALRYDLVTDFEPISLVCNDSFVIVAKKTMPDDLKEFIAWLKRSRRACISGSPRTTTCDNPMQKTN